MTSEKLRNLYFKGTTRELSWRLDTLTKINDMLIEYKEKIHEALDKDLRQTLFIKWTEIHSVQREIVYLQKNLHKWMQDEKVSVTNLTEDIFSTSKVIAEPYGAVLIIGAWNYPFSLLLRPLIGAISAGNVVCLKPSEISSHSSAVIYEMISKTFSDHIVCVQGDADVTKGLLSEKWDYIFFTGSKAVGKHVMRAAAEHLTPLTLELGGKSPVVIDQGADLELAAKRLIFGKFVNCGQTCIAPDHVYVPSIIKEKFVGLMKKYILQFYGDAQKSSEYPRIINQNHFDRLATILEAEKENIIFGGSMDKNDLFIAPTILSGIKQDSSCMQQELFGPILPIIEYEKVTDLIPILNKVKPLVLYVFSERDGAIEYFSSQTSSGCITINDCLTQHHVTALPFGGVGDSGFGKYHGKHSFDTFTHKKSYYERPTIPLMDNEMRYPPHTQEKLNFAEKLDFSIHLGWIAFILFPIAAYTLSRYVKEQK